jgi:mono/diheme cytochrome c family protein
VERPTGTPTVDAGVHPHPSPTPTPTLSRRAVADLSLAAFATLDHIGMFKAPLAQAPAGLPKLSDPSSADLLDARARSYLHANCSHCHRPAGGGQGTMDLRYGEAFKDTVTCNAAVTQGNVGPGSKIIVPGDPLPGWPTPMWRKKPPDCAMASAMLPWSYCCAHLRHGHCLTSVLKLPVG